MARREDGAAPSARNTRSLSFVDLKCFDWTPRTKLSPPPEREMTDGEKGTERGVEGGRGQGVITVIMAKHRPRQKRQQLMWQFVY